MNGTAIQKKVVEAMVIMNAALVNLRLYPPTSAMIVNSVERAHDIFSTLLEREESVTFSESEKNVLISGHLLPQKDQERPQVQAFLEMMLNFGIRSISLERGMERTELLAFLEIMTRKKEDIDEQGGLSRLIAQRGLPHIVFDQKVFVATGKDDRPISTPATGIGAGDHPGEQFDRIISMMSSLEEAADEATKEDLSEQIVASIAGMEVAPVGKFLTRYLDELKDKGLFDRVVREIDDQTLTGVASMVKQIGDGVQEDTISGGLSDPDVFSRVYSAILQSYRAKKETPQDGGEESQQKERLKETVHRMLQWDDETFFDEKVLRLLPGIVDQLCNANELRMAGDIIDKLGGGILLADSPSRSQAMEALVIIMDGFSSEHQREIVERLAEPLVRWVTTETAVTPSYGRMWHELGNCAKDLIVAGSFAECVPIVEAFNLVHLGIEEKSDEMRDMAGTVLAALAAEETVDPLLLEFETNDYGRRDEAARILSLLGAVSLPPLLDLLKESNDGEEQTRILYIICDMGAGVVPFLIDSISAGSPAYFARNLLYAVGKIGGEEHAGALQRFLLHEDSRVRETALKSMYTIGGPYRAGILRSVLPSVDEELKISVVGMLGELKDVAAVPALLEILENKPLMASKGRSALEEMICTALGNIGSDEAIPVLSAISGKKTLLGIKSYHPKVKTAAEKALETIESGNVESG